ncbi:Necrosis inducing protein (NPP1) [Geosmithia morbida]|uniref:Necrosis inducing protein (NPP1) n=1 Tax=Geosmithia morbida TaxID=1094350 RepID=A0A9P4Z0E5_9HYPO|nr:Necrosis inducing protein (NPP1) [Geosmithia morbida]KAF4124978.1 Necrosis inducing protein (NPP1) [Geosmithia morbida]
MQKTLVALVALGSAQVQATPLSTVRRRDIIEALPESASDDELRFQPQLDFDSDGCYQTAAISPDGTCNPGQDATGTPQGNCRDPRQLESSNTYSRKRCNNGYCAYMQVPLPLERIERDGGRGGERGRLDCIADGSTIPRLTRANRYEHYFEKDQAVLGSFLGGHRHEWENIVVFTQAGSTVRVAPSCHGKYDGASNEFPVDGTSPQLVYHKDGVATHCFRFANDDDISNPANPTGSFFKAPLVGWDSWSDESLRDTMLSNWSGGVGPKLDDEFTDSLRAAAGDYVPGFDPSVDE